MSQRERRIQWIAVGFAVVALLIAGIAVFVVASRPAERPRHDRASPARRHVAASDLAKLQPATVEQVGDGLRVIDGALRTALGLAASDTIVAVSGRRVTRAYELRELLRELGALKPHSVFVDLVRDREPVLERWELDGDLEAARRAEEADLGGLLKALPSVSPIDPLSATVARVNDTTFVVPRATFEAWLANPVVVAAGGRGVPASNFGLPDGFELYEVRPGSIYAALGIQAGDTIRAINGTLIESADAALALVARSTTQVTVDIRRGGQPMILNYLIK